MTDPIEAQHVEAQHVEAQHVEAQHVEAQHQVTLITRAGCHLCEQAESELRALAAELGFGLELLDVDADRQRANEYSDRVPVILIDGAEHGYWRLEEQRFRTALRRPRR